MLHPAGRPAGMTLGLPGCVVRLRWDDRGARQTLRALYPYHRLRSNTRADVVYQLRRLPHRPEPAWSIREDGRLLVGSCPALYLAETLERRITRRVMARQRGSVILHAAAVALRDGCVLLPGTSGAGKTTLVLALRDRGLQALGDDILLLDPRRMTVRAFPRSFLIKGPGTGAHRSAAARPSRLRLLALRDVHGGGKADRELPVNWIIFPERCARLPAELLACPDTECLRRLVNLSVCRLAGKERAFRALSRLAGGATCHILKYSEANRGAAAIAQLVRRRTAWRHRVETSATSPLASRTGM